MSARYENARFFATLDEIGELLAELQYVDLARPYLEVLPWNATYEMHDVTLGTRHPFDVRITVNEDPSWEQVQQRLDAFRDEAASRFGGVPDEAVASAGPLVGFEPDEHRATVRQLSRIHDLLVEGGTSDLALLERTLDDWTGRAADAFALDFYAPLTLVHANQCYLMQESAKAMAAAIGLLGTAQDSLMNAVLAARDVLDDQLRARVTGDTGVSSREFVTIAGAAMGIINVLRFVQPPSAAALTLGVIGTGLAREFGFDDIGSTRTTIEATCADEVAESLGTEVDHVLARANAALAELNGVVGVKRGELATMLDDGRLHAPRPALDADVAPGSFRYQFGRR